MFNVKKNYLQDFFDLTVTFPNFYIFNDAISGIPYFTRGLF